MKHFTAEEWIDFVNQVTSPSASQAMERHLKQGCKQCLGTLSIWQRVRQAAVAEKDYQAPATAVRIAKAAFSGSSLQDQRKEARSRIAVLFDSFLQPAFEGVRSASLGTRQMLYRADPFQVDLQIEAKPDGNHLIVTGQLLDLSNPGITGKDVPVTLSNMHGHVVHSVSNQHGEFSCEIKNSGDLQMTFKRLGGEPIVISLRDALSHVPEEQK